MNYVQVANDFFSCDDQNLMDALDRCIEARKPKSKHAFQNHPSRYDWHRCLAVGFNYEENPESGFSSVDPGHWGFTPVDKKDAEGKTVYNLSTMSAVEAEESKNKLIESKKSDGK